MTSRLSPIEVLEEVLEAVQDEVAPIGSSVQQQAEQAGNGSQIGEAQLDSGP